MILIITTKNTDNIIGIKEEVAMRLEGVADVMRIDCLPDNTPIIVHVDRKADNERKK